MCIRDRTPIRTETGFLGFAPPCGIAALCTGHCSMREAQDIRGHDDLTSSPPSSELTPAVSYESPPLRAGNIERGLRSLRDLTQHLTTRADDNHAPPVYRPCGEHISALFRHMSSLGKVLRVASN